MKILIVGAGIAGLSLAAHLQKQKHDVHIVDKVKDWRESGYAINVWNFGLKALESFNIDNKLKKHSYSWSEEEIFNNHGKSLLKLNWAPLFNRYGKSIYIHRHDLHAIFLKLNTYPIHLNTSIAAIKQNQKKVLVTFTTGIEDVYDLVVGADGVNSIVREMVIKKNARSITGFEFWGGVIPKNFPYELKGASILMYKNKGFMLYPFNEKELCFTFLKPIDDKDYAEKKDNMENIEKNFKDASYLVPLVLPLLPKANDVYHGFTSNVDVHEWYNGRVVLIGDAAHAMLPLTGMGTSMALEDSLVLVEELSTVNANTVTDALSRYFHRRKKRLNEIRKNSDFFGWIVNPNSKLMVFVRDTAIQVQPRYLFYNGVEKFIKYKI